MKNRLFFIAALLPLLSFGDVPVIDVPVSVWPYRFSATGTGFTKPAVADAKAMRIDVSSLPDYFFCNSSAAVAAAFSKSVPFDA